MRVIGHLPVQPPALRIGPHLRAGSQGVTGIKRVAGCDHHDRDPVRLLRCRRHLDVEYLISIGEGEAQVTNAGSNVDRHLGAPRNSEQARQAVDLGRGGKDLSGEIGELLYGAGRGHEIAVPLGLVP
jgi:hypothetical protein